MRLTARGVHLALCLCPLTMLSPVPTKSRFRQLQRSVGDNRALNELRKRTSRKMEIVLTGI